MKIITVWSAVILLSLLYGWISVYIIRYKRKQKTEWERYWDEVFERNKNL